MCGKNIQSITTRKWYDFSENISGQMTNDGDYIIYRKWSFVYIRGSQQMPAYLKVKLIKASNSTKIETQLRPNVILLIFFYLIIILFFLELTGNTFIKGPRIAILIFLPAFDLILFGLIILLTSGLKDKFERVMHLQ
jgi:hypothetical protein